jgi:RNA polymerase sigma factor (sigma-70 family)
MTIDDGEVERLIQAYQETHDRRAFERLLALHARVLNHLVRRYSGSSGETREDLLQVAHVGLVKAVKGYRAGSGAQFGSYAYAMVDGELRHHLRDTGLVKKPRWARSLYARVSKAAARLTLELGRQPTAEELAVEVNVSAKGIRELMKLYRDTSVVSLDGVEGDSVDLSAIRSVYHESFTLPIEDRIQLEQALESLTELQQRVIYLFFYMDLTQTEIGRRLGLPQRRVSRLVASSLKALRTF